MGKVKSGVTGQVVRIGDLLSHPFEIAEVSSDDKGPYAIVDLLGDRSETDKEQSVVVAIDPGANAVTLGDPDVTLHPIDGEAAAGDTPPDAPVSEAITRRAKAAKSSATFVSVAVRRSLAVKLTKSEIAEKADEAATTHRQIGEVEEEKKANSQMFAARIKDLRGQLARVVECHHTGEERRSVDCSQVFDLKSGKTWYDFQGNRHEERRMTDYEVRETNGTLFGDAQIEGALNAPTIDEAPDSPKPKTSEELHAEAAAVGQRAVAAADKREQAKEKKRAKDMEKGIKKESVLGNGAAVIV